MRALHCLQQRKRVAVHKPSHMEQRLVQRCLQINIEKDVHFWSALKQNHWSHMDYFFNVFMNFFELESFGYVDCELRDRNVPGLTKNVLSVPKTNESLMAMTYMRVSN